MKSATSRLSLAVAALLGLRGITDPEIGLGMPSFGRSEPSAAQKRRHAAWVADAPRRNALAVEIAIWNEGVKRRNKAFARTGRNKHQRGLAT